MPVGISGLGASVAPCLVHMGPVFGRNEGHDGKNWFNIKCTTHVWVLGSSSITFP